MKLVVFSDVHRNKHAVERIFDFNSGVDYYISLGDTELPYDYLNSKNIIMVKGNYPFDAGKVYEHTLTVEDIRILLVHGHKFGVHKSLNKLTDYARRKKYDIALFGHTHIAYYEQIGKLLLLNPGSCSRPRNTLPPTYLIIEINKTHIQYTYKDAYTNNTIEF